MSRVPIGRRDFLGGRLRAAIVGGTPARDEGETRADDSERAPFDRRTRGRAALAGAKRVARVDRFACLASASMVCTSCHEHCPEPGAIRFEAGHPVVAAERCTGCGECEAVCPAPTGAIRVLPILPARAP
ncbi:MAG: 4Fe-4S binding protein [Polyangiales bacterium]